MTLYDLDNMPAPIGDVLHNAGSEGVLLGVGGEPSFAELPLDEEVLDLLIERNPRFIEECRQIKERMRLGNRVSHEDVRAMFSADTK
jgi:hypothetical protein